MKLIFNSMSLENLVSIEQIVFSIENLLKIKNRLLKPEKIVLLFHSEIVSRTLENGKNFLSFLNDYKTSEYCEIINFLIYHIVNEPFIDEMENITEIDVLYNEKSLHELKIVYSYEEYCLKSFFTDNKWEEFSLSCELNRINSSGDIEVNKVNIKNLGKFEKINENVWLHPLLNDNKLDSFLKSLNEYKFLIISSNVIESLNNLGNNESLLNALARNFEIMNNYCTNNWKFGELRIAHLKDLGITTLKPESQPTLDKFGEERKFKDINDSKSSEPFSLHFNLPEDRRCYIKGLVDEEGIRKIYIAYIGEHLRTVKFA